MKKGKSMITINGTENDDFIFAFEGVGEVNARKGDDHIYLDSDYHDIIVDGGFGFDTFEFQTTDLQTVTFNQIDEEKTVIKVFDAETGNQMQKIVLLDIEQIDWSMIG